MKFARSIAAFALAAAPMPAAALADDPNDPAMRDPRARARDAEQIRKLNRDMLDQVQQRDAQYSQGWQAYRDYPQRQAEYQAALAAHQRTVQQFSDNRANYEARMAEWRRAVDLCRSGHHEYCQ